MKQKRTYRHAGKRSIHCPAYPNAASKAYLAGKFLTVCTALVSGVGLMGTMMLLVSLS